METGSTLHHDGKECRPVFQPWSLVALVSPSQVSLGRDSGRGSLSHHASEHAGRVGA